MRLAEYPFYSGVYRGSLSFENFDALVSGASGLLDEMTFGRLRGHPITDDIKMAVCAIVDKLFESQETRGISSEKIGNVSVTYSRAGTDSVPLSSVAKRYIKDKTLFYRGV